MPKRRPSRAYYAALWKTVKEVICDTELNMSRAILDAGIDDNPVAPIETMESVPLELRPERKLKGKALLDSLKT